MRRIKNMIEHLDYGGLSIFEVTWHYWDSEWHISALRLEWGEFDRSFFSIGRRGDLWFFDALWIRVLPH